MTPNQQPDVTTSRRRTFCSFVFIAILCLAVVSLLRSAGRAEDQGPAAEQTTESKNAPAPAEAIAGGAASSIRIARLVERLGSQSYLERTDASQKLAELGGASRRALEAAATADDPEVRLRAAELLKQLKTNELWSAGHISCRSRNEPAGKTLATLADQTGNHLLLGGPLGTFHDALVDLDYPSGDFWPTVDDICRHTGNVVRTDFEGRRPGAVVVSGDAGTCPTAYAGPLRAEITELSWAFAAKVRFAPPQTEQTNTFEFEMNVRWEDRLRLTGFRAQPEVVEAVTDTGTHLSGCSGGANSWNVLGPAERKISARVKLTAPLVAAKQLDRLAIAWNLLAVGDFASLSVDELTSRAIHRQDDVELTIESIQRHEAHLDVTLLVSRDGPLPEAADALFQEYTVELFDTEGRAIRLDTQACALTDKGVEVRLAFSGDFDQSPPKSLTLTYPRIRDQRKLQLVFRHVPLPTARPE